jgi:hypothetical protein
MYLISEERPWDSRNGAFLDPLFLSATLCHHFAIPVKEGLEQLKENQ